MSGNNSEKTLKAKAVNATKWSLISQISNTGISFVLSLILARLLTPAEYGLIGLTSAFTSIFLVFVTSGFSSSIIRRQDITQQDLSTVFWFNLTVSILLYLLLFFFAPIIGLFFNQPIVADIVRVTGLLLIVGGVSLIQNTIRIKNLDFKVEAKISVVSNVVSGCSGIIFALYGFGVWSLVAQLLIKQVLTSFLFWFSSSWRPSFFFSIQILRRHLRYSFNILQSQLIAAFVNNAFIFIIGRFYSASIVGLYSRADMFSNLFSKNLEQTASKIFFPLLCSVSSNIEQLKVTFVKVMMLLSFVSALLTLSFVAISDNFIPVAIGDQWAEVPRYMTFIVLAAFLYPINTVNIRIANVVGKSDVFMKAIAFQRTLFLVSALIGAVTTVEVLLIGISFVSVITFIYNCNIVKKLLFISVWEQVRMLYKSLRVIFLISLLIWCIGNFLPFSNLINLIFQLFTGLFIYWLYFEKSKHKQYFELKELIINEINKVRAI